jgi:uncharacterized protein involved in exopolysaccharide biosynthesis
MTDGKSKDPNSTPADGYAIRVYPIVEGGELRLAELWQVVVDGRWLVIWLSAACAIFAILMTFLITPMYRAQVLMQPVAVDRARGALSSLAGQLGGLGALAGVNVNADDNEVKSIATMNSRDFTRRFIEKHDLLPVLFADAWNTESGTWQVQNPAEIPDLWDATARFDKDVRVIAQDAETGLVTLTINWSDPTIARDWANKLVDEVNQDLRARAIEQSRRRIEYLQTRLKETNEVEVRTAAFALIEAEMKDAMLSAVKADFAFEVVDPAIAPEKRYWPNRGLFAVVGLAAGLLLGLAWVFLRRATSR